MMVAYGVVVLPFAVIPGLAVGAVVALVSGAPFAMMTTSCSVLVQRNVPATRITESFSILNAGLMGGAAAGAGLASLLVDSRGPRTAMVTASIAPLLAGIALLWLADRPARQAGRHVNLVPDPGPSSATR